MIINTGFAGVVPAGGEGVNQENLYTGRQLDPETRLFNYRARYYHSTIGRFLSRDLIEYDAGTANLYNYVGNNYLSSFDPFGLARLSYTYHVVWLYSGTKMSKKDWDNLKELSLLMDNEVENLLMKFGIDASSVLLTFASVKVPGRIWGEYDFTDLDQEKEWNRVRSAFEATKFPADDIIIFVPGNLAVNRQPINPKLIAAHWSGTHVIGVSQLALNRMARLDRALNIAHEILHHFLEDTIRPSLGNAWEKAHDDEGIMAEIFDPRDPNKAKLGCKTVNALKKLGVTDKDIDSDSVIKK